MGNDAEKENVEDKDTQTTEDENVNVFGEDIIENESEESADGKPAEEEFPTSDTGL